MDTAARRAEFARNITEAGEIMALMRAETRSNIAAIASSRAAIDDTWVILKMMSLRSLQLPSR